MDVIDRCQIDVRREEPGWNLVENASFGIPSAQEVASQSEIVSLLQNDECRIGYLSIGQEKNRLSIEIGRSWSRQFTDFEVRMVWTVELDHTWPKVHVDLALQASVDTDHTFGTGISQLHRAEIGPFSKRLFDLERKWKNNTST